MQGGAFPIRAHLHPFHSHLPHSTHSMQNLFLVSEGNESHSCSPPTPTTTTNGDNHWTTIEQALNKHCTTIEQTLFNPIKYTRRFVKWNPSFWKTKPRRLGDYKKRITANLPITYKENEPRFVRHSINAHVEPRLIFNGKNTHKTTTTKHNQEKSRVQPPKSGKTSEKAARTSETQKRNEQKRRPRARSGLRAQSEKRGV